jgi:hypothetical protein
MHDNADLKALTERLVQSDVSSRVVLAFRANPSAIQRLLPIPPGMAPGESEEKWVTRAGDRADVLLHLRYTKAVPARAQVVQFIYSAAEPSF